MGWFILFRWKGIRINNDKHLYGNEEMHIRTNSLAPTRVSKLLVTRQYVFDKQATVH